MRKAPLWFGLVALGFALGYFPQWDRANRLEYELATLQHGMETCRQENRALRLSDLAAQAYLEAARHNYFIAEQQTTQLFAELDHATPSRQWLAVLNLRDMVNRALAKHDASMLPKLEKLASAARAAAEP